MLCKYSFLPKFGAICQYFNSTTCIVLCNLVLVLVQLLSMCTLLVLGVFTSLRSCYTYFLCTVCFDVPYVVCTVY